MATVATIEVFAIDGHPEVRVAIVKGRLDESNMEYLKGKLDPIIDSKEVKFLILNCQELEYMNSKIVGFLASSYSTMSGKGGKIMIADANEAILDIINMVGLTMIIEHFKTIEDATNSIGISGSTEAPAAEVEATPVEQPAPVAEPELVVESIPVVAATPVETPAEVHDTPPVVKIPFPADEPARKEEPQDEIKEFKISMPGMDTAQSDPAPEVTTRPVEDPVPVKISIPKAEPEGFVIKPAAPAVKESVPELKIKVPLTPHPEEVMPVTLNGDQTVTVMLELPKEDAVEGEQVYRTESGSVQAKLVNDPDLGRRIELTFKPGKYFFKADKTKKRMAAESSGKFSSLLGIFKGKK